MTSGRVQGGSNLSPQSFTSGQVQGGSNTSPQSFTSGQVQGGSNLPPQGFTLRSWPKNDDLVNLCNPLGFIKGTGSMSTRQHLREALNSCLETLDASSLNDKGNMIWSESLAWSFLEEYGAEFWGKDTNRKHLKEPDISKGLVYPQDAGRSVSIRSSFDPRYHRAYLRGWNQIEQRT